MSADKYPRIFSRQTDTIVYIVMEFYKGGLDVIMKCYLPVRNG